MTLGMGSKTIAIAALALAWFVAPMALSRHFVDLLVFAGIYTIAGLGVGLMLGQCGIVNIAQATFYGIGGYASGYMTVRLGLHPIAGFAIGIAISAVVAAAVGWPILRLNGFFLALATIAVCLIGNALFYELEQITGGSLGIGGIPRLTVFGVALNTPQRFYYFVWPIAFALMWLATNLVNGRPGLAMQAMRDAPPAAEVMAVDMRKLKTTVFVLSAVLGSTAGTLFAHYASYVSVESFTILRSINFVLIPVIAGVTTIWGLVVGALFVTLLPELLSGLGDIHQILFGLALVLIVRFMPEGIVGWVIDTAARKRTP
jgi:branched-chain amino acid transport system permease protein